MTGAVSTQFEKFGNGRHPTRFGVCSKAWIPHFGGCAGEVVRSLMSGRGRRTEGSDDRLYPAMTQDGQQLVQGGQNHG